MKKYTAGRFSRATILNGILTILLMLVVISSCKPRQRTSSVKDIRAQKGYGEFDTYGRTPFRPTAPKDLLTRGLFLQNKRANIELPHINDAKIDPATGQVVVSEDVTYKNASNYSEYFDNSDIKADTVYGLKEVMVEAKSRFAPEVNGQIAIDFIITVPRQLLSPVWRVTLNPRVLDNDSIVDLQPLILKGGEFVQRQINDYTAYDAYLNSIVDTADYDSVFLDVDGIRFDILDRQHFYYNKYYKEWNRQMAYEKWKVEEENRNERYMNQQIGQRNELFHEYMRKANEESMRSIAYGLDTTGTNAKYMEQYKRATSALPEQWEVNTAARNIPKDFSDIHESGRTLQDLYNDIMTESDSMKIAKHRYFFDLIAENELKSARKDDRQKELIPYPFETGMRDTLEFGANEDVVYLYKQTYPTRVGLKSLAVLMDGKITAIDHSTYTIGTSDTIKYFVASQAQLVDMSLMSSETVLHREAYNELNLALTFAPNANSFDQHYGNNRTEIAKLMDAYNTLTGPGKAAGYNVDSIEVAVFTDLSGSYDGNYELSQKRGKSIIDFMYRNYGQVLDGDIFKQDTKVGGEDWQTLVNSINASSNITNKSQIIEILSTALDTDEAKADIKQKYRSDYNTIVQSIYPKLSRAKIGFNLSRSGMSEDRQVLTEEKPDYDKGIQLILDRDYNAAMKIMANYPDYNTALLLSCMGHNGQALDLVVKQPKTGYTEYLTAILMVRLGREAEAIEHLKEACKIDPSKIFRSNLDPEILNLVQKYNLKLEE